MLDLTDSQINRYARHIMLREVGGEGQSKLLSSSALIVGAGGLGAPMLLYLAAAGVGRIGIVDDDVVDLSNLQRQVIHDTGGIGVAKVDSAAARIAAINPDVKVEIHKTRLNRSNVLDIIASYDVVADGTDNFATRFLLNDACHLAGRTLVSAAMLRFDGQLSTFKSHLGDPHPCYRCVFREPPPPGMIPSCSEGGVLGALAGTMGSMQAVEVLKELLGIGDSLSGRMLMYSALETGFRTIRLRRDTDCPVCGLAPAYKDLSHHPF